MQNIIRTFQAYVLAHKTTAAINLVRRCQALGWLSKEQTAILIAYARNN